MKIKYLYRSFKAANEQGNVNAYLFYLQLKAMGFAQDEILKGNSIKTIKSTLGYSTGSISNYLKKCVKLGYISLYKHDSGKDWKYVLTSYKKVWNKFNKRFDTDCSNIPNYRFETIELPSVNKKIIKAFILTTDLSRNKRDQEFSKFKQEHPELVEAKRKALIALRRKKKYHKKTFNEVKSEKVRKRKEFVLESSIAVKHGLQNSLTQENKPTENMISNNKTNSLMGFRTNKPVSKIVKIAKELQILDKKSKNTLIASGISYFQYLTNPIFDKKHFYKSGNVYKRECSVFYFLQQLPKTNTAVMNS